jgi:ADP-ribosylglycohydrolase/fructose-1,6-bisphosphatase/inositol monophosphatase family enzyme
MYESEIEFSIQAARSAGDFLRHEFHRGLTEEADLRADEILFGLLGSKFPAYGYRSEELGAKTLPRDAAGHLWLVDPQDGSSAAMRGFRGAAVSIALLRAGLPVLGVVHAYCAPDDRGDTFWWAEGLPTIFRNGIAIKRTWPAGPSLQHTALVSQDADAKPELNAKLVHPMRFRAVPGIAYRLALVAAGEAEIAVSVNRPAGWDLAGGHGILSGSGGDLFTVDGHPIRYDPHGSVGIASSSACFGGSPNFVEALRTRAWESLLDPRQGHAAAERLCFLVPGKTVADADRLARAHGCLLGQIAGDSLGSLVEFQNAKSIQSKYPDGPRFLSDGGTWSTIAGQPTDDSELALALARSIVHEGKYNIDSAARAYSHWYESQPFDIGSATRQALSAASRGPAAAHAAANSESQANGALMRVSPLGIFGAALDSRQNFASGSSDASLTHPHRVCREASGIMSAAIAHAIHSGCSPTELHAFAIALAKSMDVCEGVANALADAAGKPPHDFISLAGWVLVAFQNAFYRLLHASSLEEGIVDTVRHGGDTDTNAAIAGSLLGAVHGRGAIPFQWFDRLVTCRPIQGLAPVKRPRPPQYWPVDALALAERLLAAGNETRGVI